MARRRSIVQSLSGAPEEPQAPATVPAPPLAQEPQEPAKAPQKRASRKLEAVPTEESAEPALADEKPTRAAPPAVLTASTTEAKRVGLYLHPDDYRALGMAKLDDGADANARIRAMIALWRSNDRYRAAVDKLARTAPRGAR